MISEYAGSLGIKLVTVCICDLASGAYGELSSVASFPAETANLQVSSSSLLVTKVPALQEYAVLPYPNVTGTTGCRLAFIVSLLLAYLTTLNVLLYMSW